MTLKKDNVLGMLSALAPNVFVLTEPDSDHETDESAAMWSTRLTRAGFLSMPMPPVDSVAAPVSVQIAPDHVSLGFEGEPLVAQFCLGLAGDR